MDVRTELGLGVSSVEAIRALTGLSRPVKLKDIFARYNDPIIFDEPLVTPDGVALGGHHTITINRNGAVRHQGDMRATGLPSFTYGVHTVIANDAGIPLLLYASGKVHGSNEPGDRESTWDLTDQNGLIPMHWAEMKRARVQTDISHDTNIFGELGEVAQFVGSLVAAETIAGPPGVWLLLGVRAADIVGPGTATGIAGLAGVTVAAGTLLVLGPGAFVPAIVAGAAAGAAVEDVLQHRAMRPPEREFADIVFKGTVPFDRILLTNLTAPTGVAFTIPSVGNTILLNVGAGFDDPIHYAGFGDPKNPATQAPGQMLIHELVHVWQIATSTFVPGLVCDEVVTQIENAYHYGAPGRPYGNFNPEQRAKIVDNWFAGCTGCASESAERGWPQCVYLPMDGDPRSSPEPKCEMIAPNPNPYFRYVRDNIRLKHP